MKTITVDDLKKGNKIKTQTPGQRFTHDCYKVKEVKQDSIILDCINGDFEEGENTIFDTPKDEMRTWSIEKYN